jgi:type III restriction enzyme
VYTTRIIADLVCNAWVARELIRKLVDRLRERGFTDESLGAQSSFILEELRKFLIQERDRLAEDLFLSRVGSERIQFRLRTDRHNWRMPHEVETDPEGSPQLPRPDGMLTVKSLFSPVYTAEYNKDEAEFACYLDEVKALQWWHRNVAKAGQYFVQGWRKSKVYPDFVFALIGGDSKRKLVVMETKGDQLRGNLDTEYKRRLLKVITDNFAFENVVKAGELELVVDKDTSVACDLVLISEWKTEVPNRYFGDQSPVGQELA